MGGRIKPGLTLIPGDASTYQLLADDFASPEFAAMVRSTLPRAPRFKKIYPYANLLRMVKDEDRAALRASLAEGQIHPVLFYQGRLVDGRNRARELIELKKPISTATFEGTDADLLKHLKAENIERRHLSWEERLDYASRVARMPVGINQYTMGSSRELPSLPLGDRDTAADDTPASAVETVMTQAQASEEYGVSPASIKRYNVVLDKGAPELRGAFLSGDVAVNDAMNIAAQVPVEEQRALLEKLPRDEKGKLTPEAKQQIRKVAKEVRAEDQAEKKKKRDDKEAKLGAKIRALPDVKAGLILSDFEWHFKVRSEETGMDRHASNHYVTAREAQTPEAIVERQRERMSIAADDCIHLMWCPASFNKIALDVMALQGFTYVSQFVWIKPGIGTGFWVRDKHELLLIGVKGKIPCPAMGDQFDSAIEAPKGEHSEKPDFQYEIAEHYFPNLPKIELNARRPREGWIQWGNEAPEPEQPALGLQPREAAE